MVTRRFCICFLIAICMLFSGCWSNLLGYMIEVDGITDVEVQKLLDDSEYEHIRYNGVVYKPFGYYLRQKDKGDYVFYIGFESYSENEIYISEINAISDGVELFTCNDLTYSMYEYPGWPGHFGGCIQLAVLNEKTDDLYDGKVITMTAYVGEERHPIEYTIRVRALKWYELPTV